MNMYKEMIEEIRKGLETKDKDNNWLYKSLVETMRKNHPDLSEEKINDSIASALDSIKTPGTSTHVRADVDDECYKVTLNSVGQDDDKGFMVQFGVSIRKYITTTPELMKASTALVNELNNCIMASYRRLAKECKDE